ncbi:Ger(x)C family spore germination protein [Neobacillus sp. PS2-9]|uniref:Ger(x)C family spore germination protein n=1 Tax=Neobacillus sp. PS2-9 TaxID=3070676 RepID=UPI0027DF822D|nr:Ger(x)C family spore germination protein [Neobacillus sp. PS2-9]WML57811.1 Ger(x)C family spore germination protein [Neobacillus sp. PS2-9]
MRYVCLIIFTVVILSGCWDIKEVEQQLYIHALAVDYKSGKFVLYGQVISFNNLAKQEGGANRQPQTIATVKGTGETINDAAFDLYTTAQQRFSWEHITAIVYTENTLKSGKILHVNDFLQRYYQIRNIIWTFGTKEPVEEVFAAKPILNITVLYSQLSNPDDIYKQSSSIKPIQLFELNRKLSEPAYTTHIPYLSTSKNTWKENKKEHLVAYIGGSEYLRGKRFVGYVARDHLLGDRWLTREVDRTKLSIKEDNKTIVVGPTINIKSKITPVMLNNKVKFTIDVKADFKTTEILKFKTHKELKELAENEIRKQIEETYKKGLNNKIDIYELSDVLYKQKNKEWKKIAQNGVIPLEPDTINKINVNVTILNTEQLKNR